MADSWTSACSEARYLAALAPDGMLSELEQRSLLRHLDRCAECRRFAQSVAAVAFDLRGASQARMSKVFSAPKPRRRRALGAPLATVATVAAAIAVVPFALRDPARQTPPLSAPVLIANAPVEDEQVVLRQFRDLSLARRLEPERNPGQPGMYVG